MLLRELIAGVPDARLLYGVGELEVREVRDDSRLVEPGDLFVAVPGTKADGRHFISEALARGAVAVVAEGTIPDNSTWNPERVPDLPRWNSGGEAASGPTRSATKPSAWVAVRSALGAGADRGPPLRGGRPDGVHGRHRHQRQDHHHLPAGGDPRGGRAPAGGHRHGELPLRRRCSSRRRSPRPGALALHGTAGRHAKAGAGRRGHGGDVASRSTRGGWPAAASGRPG